MLPRLARLFVEFLRRDRDELKSWRASSRSGVYDPAAASPASDGVTLSLRCSCSLVSGADAGSCGFGGEGGLAGVLCAGGGAAVSCSFVAMRRLRCSSSSSGERS